jgi:hypothetical protein
MGGFLGGWVGIPMVFLINGLALIVVGVGYKLRGPKSLIEKIPAQ